MKSKFLLIVVLSAIALSANAQTEKGKTLIGGSFGFSDNKGNRKSLSERITSYNFAPNAAYFIKDNLAIGLGLSYGRTKVKGYLYQATNGVGSVNGSNETQYMVMPYIRRYFKINEQLKVFGQTTFFASSNKVREENNYGYPTTNPTIKYHTFGASISPGLAFFPSKHFAIEFSFPLLSYSYQRYTQVPQPNLANLDNNQTLSFGLDTFNPSIGLNFHF